MIEVVCLCIYGMLVAVFGPLLLRRLTGAGSTPRLGIALWLIAAASAYSAWSMAAYHAVVHGTDELRAAATALTVAAMARISWAVANVACHTMARRAQHRDGLMLIGQRDDSLGAMIVAADQPLVYCLPSRSGIVVVTTGAQAALSPEELLAALAHERAHLAGRHHLLMAIGYALARTLPFLPLVRQLGRQIATLLEMRADDRAGRLHGRQTVARAIAAMAAYAVPAGAMGASGVSSNTRVHRLRSTRPPWRTRLATAVAVAVIALLAAGPYLATIDPWCSRYHL